MYKSVKYLAKVENGVFYTHYLYEPLEKIVLPIETLPIQHNENPNILDTLKRIVNSLESNLVGIKIFLYSEEKYYTYLSISAQGQILDIYIDIGNALEIAKTSNILISIENAILKENGIKVTKKLLEKVFAGGFGGY